MRNQKIKPRRQVPDQKLHPSDCHYCDHQPLLTSLFLTLQSALPPAPGPLSRPPQCPLSVSNLSSMLSQDYLSNKLGHHSLRIFWVVPGIHPGSLADTAGCLLDPPEDTGLHPRTLAAPSFPRLDAHGRGSVGGTDLDTALEFLLGVTEHLNIQEEPEAVVHRAKTRVSRSYVRSAGHQPGSGRPQLQLTFPLMPTPPPPNTSTLFHLYSLGLRLQLLRP